MPCHLTEYRNPDDLDINVALFGHLQLMLLLNNNEKTEFIEGFEHCVKLVEKWSNQESNQESNYEPTNRR